MIVDADVSLAKPFAHGDALRAAAARVIEVDAALAASNEKAPEVTPAEGGSVDVAAMRARATVSASFPPAAGAGTPPAAGADSALTQADVDRARAEAKTAAIRSQGADALIDVTAESYSQFWILFSKSTIMVEGTAIRFKD